MARFSRVMDRVDLQGGQRNNAYTYRDPQKGGKWHLYFLNRKRNGCSWRRPQGPTGSRRKADTTKKGISFYHQITRGPNKGKESDRPIIRNSLYGINKRTGANDHLERSSSSYIGNCCNWR